MSESKIKITKRVKVVLATLFLVLVASAGIWFFLSWANSPVEDTATILVPSTNLENDPSKRLQTVLTPFYQTMVPKSFSVQQSVNKSNPNHVQVLMHDSVRSDSQIGITTNSIPSDGMSGVSDYILRKSVSKDYKPYESSELAEGSEGFYKIAGSREYTVFLYNDTRYASISVTGEGASDNILEELLAQVVKTWSWL